MEEFCDGNCDQVLVWEKLLWYVLLGSGMEEFCYGKCHQVLVWENFVMVTVIRFWYGRFFQMVRVIRFWYGRIL